MIQELKETYSYTNWEIIQKVNEIIDVINQLDSRQPIYEVIKLEDVLAYLPGDKLFHSFMARPIK